MVEASAAPPLPDPGALAGLHPAVAFGFIGLVLASYAVYLFGPAIRARAAPKKPDPEPAPQPPPLPTLQSQADEMTARFVAHLEQQLAERDREIDSLQREVAGLRADVDRLREQLWRRRA